MPLEIKSSVSYFYLDSWVMANSIQLATQSFCTKFLNHSNDPCGRQYDQMTQAARSITANIAEGTSRHNTSREAEMKLTDVARASLSELQNDYFNWLLIHNEAPWAKDSREHDFVAKIALDKAKYGNDVVRDAALHVLRQREKFTRCIDSDNSIVVANSILILLSRLSSMLQNLIDSQLSSFKTDGGFRENLTKERITVLTKKENAPVCPKCGKKMVERTAKTGKNAGNKFWSCSSYPDCRGTLPFTE